MNPQVDSAINEVANGYCDCSCPDCFEIAIGEAGKALCWACQDAGCETEPGSACQVDHCDTCGAFESNSDDCTGCEYNLQTRS